jgi:hypothetical protein
MSTYKIAFTRDRTKIAAPILQQQLGCDYRIANMLPVEVWTLDQANELVIDTFEELEVKQFMSEILETLKRTLDLQTDQSLYIPSHLPDSD